MGLTDEQNEVYDTILTYLKQNPNNRYILNEFGILVLNAPAGTGKTHLITYINNNLNVNMVILAPTHKACEVINSKLENQKGCSTIHRFLNAEEEIDEITGEITFKMKNKAISNHLIIIDEASMVNKNMFEKFTLLSKNNLVFFIGDAFQIPPVKESKSVVFTLQNQLTLTKNMRSTKSLSNHYLQKFRDGVEKISTTMINMNDKKNNSFIRNEFKNNKDVIILAWTNSKVKHWNNLIREHKFYDKLDELDKLDKFYKDEKLLFSGYRCVNADLKNNIPEDIKYYSNDTINIKYLEKKNLDIKYPKCQHMINTDLKGTGLNMEISHEKRKNGCSLCDIKSHRNESKSIKFYEITDQYNVVWYKSIYEEFKDIRVILNEYKHKALKLKNKETWIEYYSMKNKYDPELNYSYSSTVHKAQGSAWDTVFVDINNIRFNKSMSDNTRLAYTAVSRMSDTVYFTI